MLDLEGTALTADEKVLLEHPLVGGVILFARNYRSPSSMTSLTQSIRAVRPELLIAVDQEGGRVQRFRKGFTRLPAMQQFLPLFRQNPAVTVRRVRDAGWLMASEVLAVGVDFSFAPVLDMDDQYCEVIASRSFSPNAEEVVVLAGAWIAGMHEAGMAATGKHFPGHGSVGGDSHWQLPVDQREFSEIASHDLIPFVRLQQQLDAVMPAHILFPAVDKNQPPAFSSYWLGNVLRGDLQYDGVIFSDDLAMEGAAGVGSFPERASLALAAGCDMILVCNHRRGVQKILESLVPPENLHSERRLATMRARTGASVVCDPPGAFDSSGVCDPPGASRRWQLTRQFLHTITG